MCFVCLCVGGGMHMSAGLPRNSGTGGYGSPIWVQCMLSHGSHLSRANDSLSFSCHSALAFSALSAGVRMVGHGLSQRSVSFSGHLLRVRGKQEYVTSCQPPG